MLILVKDTARDDGGVYLGQRVTTGSRVALRTVHLVERKEKRLAWLIRVPGVSRYMLGE